MRNQTEKEMEHEMEAGNLWDTYVCVYAWGDNELVLMDLYNGVGDLRCRKYIAKMI